MIQRFESNGRYHNVIRYDKLLFLSGQTATEMGDDISSQSRAVLKKIENILRQHGSDKRHILHADVYLPKQDMVQPFNAVWDAWTEKGYEPTRACMVAALGRPPILVEIVVIAAIADT